MSSDKHVSVLFREIDILSLQTQFINILTIILVILGVVGNISGFLIFSLSRRFRRISSAYVRLATCSSIINLLCVVRYASVLHTTTRYLLHQFIGQTWWACKFYEFSLSFRVISSWIILFWIFERLICVSKGLRRFFHRWCSFKLNFMIPIIMIILIVACVIGPPVYMYEPWILKFTSSFSNDTMDSTVIMMDCEVNSNASIQWQIYFHAVHLGMNHFTVQCLFSEFIPTGTIFLFNSCIIYHIVRTDRYLHRAKNRRPNRRQSQTASRMNVILILHSSLFLASLLAHIAGHFTIVQAHEVWWVLLAVLLNCSLNFYIYCLSGKDFRDEIRRFFRHCRR